MFVLNEGSCDLSSVFLVYCHNLLTQHFSRSTLSLFGVDRALDKRYIKSGGLNNKGYSLQDAHYCMFNS